MNEDLNTLQWNEIQSDDIFSFLTDSIQGAPAKVADGALTATDQSQAAALPPAPAPAQSSASSPSAAFPGSGLLAGDEVHDLLGIDVTSRCSNRCMTCWASANKHRLKMQ